MADNKYMPSKLVPRVGAQDIRNKGWTDEGLPKGNNKHVSSPVITHTDGKIKPLQDSTNDGSFVTKTETIVEYTRVPMVTNPGNISSPIIAPVATTPRVEDSNSKFRTEATRPYATSRVSNFYWWGNSSSHNTGGTHEYGRPYDTGINKYHQPNDGGMYQHLHEPSPHRHEKVPDAKQVPATSSINGWNMSNFFGKEAAPKESLPTKPFNLMETTADQSKGATIVVVPTKAEVLLPSIDSREAARKYGGLSSAPVVAYAPAIDSRDAAWKYRGQVL